MNNFQANFHENCLKGNIFLEIVKTLFEKSGYLVVPYGYEKTLTSVKRDLAKSDSSVTANKIRSSPDLLVYNREAKIAKFVEVKMSSYESPRLNRAQLEQYRAYWDDAILVMVIPFGNRFYSQRIHDLGLKQDNEQYDPTMDFKKIQFMFENINQNDIDYYGDIAHSLIKAWDMKPCDFEQEY
jgi:hypothetical protein